MRRVKQLWKVLTHPAELRLALSGLGMRLCGDISQGSLTVDETAALIRWAEGVRTFVEVGTLFGFTARAVARRTAARVVAVDNFCWNPFGLTSDEHERFTRRVLENSGIELVRAEATDFLSSLVGDGTMVFLDGDHSYEGVVCELKLLKKRGVSVVSGHDYGNAAFGVTRAVREVFGEPDEVVGLCWMKRTGL